MEPLETFGHWVAIIIVPVLILKLIDIAILKKRYKSK